MYCMEENRLHPATATESATVIRVDARPRSGREGSPNRSRDRKGALLALPIDLTLPYGRGSDWSTPYARILSLGRHLRKALTYVSRTRHLVISRQTVLVPSLVQKRRSGHRVGMPARFDSTVSGLPGLGTLSGRTSSHRLRCEQPAGSPAEATGRWRRR